MIADVLCKIINKELPSEIILEEDEWLAIPDIHPQAPAHALIMPKKHMIDLEHADDSDKNLLGTLLIATKKVAKKLGIDKTGYRLIINYGEHGGQLVPHLHIHLLGGKRLGPKIVT